MEDKETVYPISGTLLSIEPEEAPIINYIGYNYCLFNALLLTDEKRVVNVVYSSKQWYDDNGIMGLHRFLKQKIGKRLMIFSNEPVRDNISQNFARGIIKLLD
jgi:hypothetical protein